MRSWANRGGSGRLDFVHVRPAAVIALPFPAMAPGHPSTRHPAPVVSIEAIPAGGVPSYESALAYEHARIGAAAIYCSDGRVGEHFDDFLQNGLALPRHDRVALPGGPACLAGHPQAHLEEQGVVDELKFLVEVHGLKRVVLIAHESCAFYAERLGLRDRRLELVQRADLVRAAAVVRRVTEIDAVEGYFARLVQGRMRFERVEV